MPGPWQLATVAGIRSETATAKTFRLQVPDRQPHKAGQHYLIRLTAPDGYRAQRSYSIASAAGSAEVELTVELLPEGEVSSFLHEVVEVGDELEVRGPMGGFFAWDATTPALGVAGGSGVVPLMSMLRTARATGRPELLDLVVSVRAPEELYYRDELFGPGTTVVYTRSAPGDSTRPIGRLSPADLPADPLPSLVFVCGSPAFCDAATTALIARGVDTTEIRVERFGPSG